MKRAGGRPRLGPAAQRRHGVLVKLTRRELQAARRKVRELVKSGKRATVAGWFRDRGLQDLEVSS